MFSIKKLFIKIAQGFLEYLMFFPIFMIIGVNFIKAEQLLGWLFGLFLLFVAGIIFRSFFKRYTWWFFSLFAIVSGISFTYIFTDRLLLIIIFSIIHLIVVYRGMIYVIREFDDLLPVPILWGGVLGVYLISYFFFKYVEILQPYMQSVIVAGIVFIIITIFISNGHHLKRTTLSKEKQPFISQTIKRQNRVFLSVTILMIVLITNAKVVQESLWNGFKAVVKWLIKWLASGEDEQIREDTPPQAPVDPVLPFVEEKESSAFMDFLEMIATYVAYVFAGIVVIMLLMLWIKKTRVWLIKVFKSLFHFLKDLLNQAGTEEISGYYMEEKESVFDWKQWKDLQQEKTNNLMKKIFKRQPSWESLSNQQKIKFVYQTFVEQEVSPEKYKSYETPREVLRHIKNTLEADQALVNQLKKAYEQVRYGEKDVDEKIAKEIYKLIHQQKGN